MDNQNAGWRGKFAGAALGLSVFAVAWFAIAALGSRFGLWSWQFGLGQMTMGLGPIVLGLALLMALAALVISLIKAPRKRPLMLSLAALVITGLLGGRLAAFGALAQSLPPIHDVQTDWTMPVQPTEKLLAARTATGALNPIEDAPVIDASADGRWPGFGGKLVSAAQEEAEFNPASGTDPRDARYPELAPIVSPVSYEATFEAIRAVVKKRGWAVVTDDVEKGILEATETSAFFGFKDDVLIRVSPVDGVARVDVRSVSRVGLSDLGANAKRTGNLLTDIRRALSTQPS